MFAATQVLSRRQQPEHAAAVQKQLPPTHWSPAPQGGPLPQAQVP
jgi:hypothetical protein